MRKYIVFILAMFSTPSLFAQDEVFKSNWLNTPVVIDGNASEWSQPLRYYDAGTKLFFAFANDDKNLFLCFQTNDDMNRMKIMKAGMEVSLNIKGAHKATIDFPLEGNGFNDEHEKSGMSPGNEAKQDVKFAFISHDSMMVKGFATRNGIISINDNSGINAAINHDATKKFTYEIAIPIMELLGTDYKAGEILKHITLDVKINAMKGQGHTMGNNFSGRTGGGRMGGGGMHHGRNGNNSTNNEQQPSIDADQGKTDISVKSGFKQKFVLARHS